MPQLCRQLVSRARLSLLPFGLTTFCLVPNALLHTPNTVLSWFCWNFKPLWVNKSTKTFIHTTIAISEDIKYIGFLRSQRFWVRLIKHSDNIRCLLLKTNVYLSFFVSFCASMICSLHHWGNIVPEH